MTSFFPPFWGEKVKTPSARRGPRGEGASVSKCGLRKNGGEMGWDEGIVCHARGREEWFFISDRAGKLSTAPHTLTLSDATKDMNGKNHLFPPHPIPCLHEARILCTSPGPFPPSQSHPVNARPPPSYPCHMPLSRPSSPPSEFRKGHGPTPNCTYGRRRHPSQK